jgi:hypothetical protein
MAIIWVGTGRFNAYIGPVQDYIDRVVAADVAAGNTLGLEVGVRDAYDVFIRDSINVGDLGTSGGVLSQANSIIKAAPIMAGARTLAGALVPLVGPAPTNFNFVSGDYNRKTGLVGDGSTKYLALNRTVNADPQNNRHLSAFPTAVSGSGIRAGVSVPTGNNGLTVYINASSNLSLQLCGHDVNTARPFAANQLIGGGRSNATQIIARTNGDNSTHANNSVTPVTDAIFMYSNGNNQFFNPSRFAFYSIGESLDLALLDARITTLIDTFGAVIP